MLAAFASIWLSSAQAADGADALLRIERVPEAITLMEGAPAMAAMTAPKPLGPVTLEGAPETLQKAAAGKVDREGWLRDLEKAVQEAPGELPEGLDEIAGRLEKAATEMSGLDATAAQARGAEIEESLAGRDDRAIIESLAAAMAAPQLDGEVQLATLRAMAALDDAYSNGAAIKALDGAGLDTRVTVLLAESRVNPDRYHAPLSPADATAAGTIRRIAELASLPEEDIVVLARFYESESGRVRRDALLSTFRSKADAAADATISDFMKELARQSE